VGILQTQFEIKHTAMKTAPKYKVHKKISWQEACLQTLLEKEKPDRPSLTSRPNTGQIQQQGSWFLVLGQS
jgi:hypothetical protein